MPVCVLILLRVILMMSRLLCGRDVVADSDGVEIELSPVPADPVKRDRE